MASIPSREKGEKPAAPDAETDRAVRLEYARLAAGYDERWSFYVRATLGETMKRLRLGPSERVLDVGCGTASLFSLIARRFPSAELYGVDVCLEMLEVARRKHKRPEPLLAAGAMRLPFRSGAFDVLVSCNAFHYFREPAACLAEFTRVLKTGGRLLLTDWCDDYLPCRLCDLFLRLTDPAHFKTYGRSECEGLLRAAGFENVRIERYKISWLWGLMTAEAQAPPG